MNGRGLVPQFAQTCLPLVLRVVWWCRNRVFDTWHNIPLAFLLITATLVRAPDSVKQMHLAPPRFPALGIGISKAFTPSTSGAVNPCVCVCTGAGVAWRRDDAVGRVPTGIPQRAPHLQRRGNTTALPHFIPAD